MEIKMISSILKINIDNKDAIYYINLDDVSVFSLISGKCSFRFKYIDNYITIPNNFDLKVEELKKIEKEYERYLENKK